MNTISSFCWNLLRSELESNFGDNVHVRNISKDGKRIQLGVNWDCMGEQTADKAAEFAQNLYRASCVAADHPVNGATIVYA